MHCLLPPAELLARIRAMPKEQVKALRDAALDVAKGSRRPMLPDTARLALQHIALLHPDLD